VESRLGALSLADASAEDQLGSTSLWVPKRLPPFQVTAGPWRLVCRAVNPRERSYKELNSLVVAYGAMTLLSSYQPAVVTIANRCVMALLRSALCASATGSWW
jgi:hypothetical protein